MSNKIMTSGQLLSSLNKNIDKLHHLKKVDEKAQKIQEENSNEILEKKEEMSKDNDGKDKKQLKEKNSEVQTNK